MLGDRKKSAKKLAKRELKKDGFEKAIVSFLLILTVVSTSVLFLFLISQISFTGYAVYLESSAGTVSQVEIQYEGFSPYWFGIFGLVTRVPEINTQPYSTYSAGEVVRQDISFSCIQKDAIGGNELYISPSQSIGFGTLQPANTLLIDEAVGCPSGNGDCPSDTFTDTMSILVGGTNISNIPSTESFRLSDTPDYLSIGALTDGTNFVYVTHITAIETTGDLEPYKDLESINYQAIIPIEEGQEKNYYFFTDENDICPFNQNDTLFVVASVSGHVYDEQGLPIEDAMIALIGESVQTDANGFYAMTLSVPIGTSNIFATKTGYKNVLADIEFSELILTVEKDFILEEENLEDTEVLSVTVEGSVRSAGGTIIPTAEIFLGNARTTANSLGNYVINANVIKGNNTIIAIKTGYNNYNKVMNFSTDQENQTQNIVMTSASENDYITGPFTEESTEVTEVQEELIATGEDFWISATEINKEVRQNTFIEEIIGVYNLRESNMNIKFQLSSSLKDFVKIDKTTMSITPETFSNLKVTIYGTPAVGTYQGTITVSGDLDQEIPVTIKVVEKQFSVEILLMDIDIFQEVIRPGAALNYKLSLQNLLRNQDYKVFLTAKIKDLLANKTHYEEEYSADLDSSVALFKEITVPENLTTGDYLLEITAQYLDRVSSSTTPFVVSKPIYMYSFFGVSLWIIFVAISSLAFIGLNLFAYKRYADRKKRYKIAVDYATLAQPGKRTVKLGFIAETKKPALYELDRLTTHAIVAGATGMGKSISAQVLIEECLARDIAVVIFDPTAQWSGMLRKCTDKKMLGFYPKFGLKPKDARAFKGNVRMIQDCKQILNLNKYIAPGEIQIFSMNKLTPAEIDVFVENAIKQIFRSDPKEASELKVLLVFDEVHRLLPKFGGSGKGFLQIERCCREFRKWGLGVMLISQVLNDFVGEIKANINTELQARTLDEGDLERIKSKYGEEFLKALVRAEIGVIMFQNAEYNRGRPYFINFRPILHSTRRLTDEELQKYNKYNETVDGLEFQVEELEKEEIDTFDLKMELKLIKDKIMSGSFSVVEIYLEGLTPRIQKEWDKLGKKPPVMKLELVDDAEMAAEDAKAAAEKKTADAKAAPAAAGATPAEPATTTPTPATPAEPKPATPPKPTPAKPTAPAATPAPATPAPATEPKPATPTPTTPAEPKPATPAPATPPTKETVPKK